jgi:hypothetical protein
MTRYYSNKYIEEFKDVFDKPYESIIESIDKVIYSFLTESINIDEAVKKLKDITEDYEFTPFKWILHHILIDNRNFNIAAQLQKSNPNAIVYKYFEHQDYGFNLLGAIYEIEIKRISYIERRSKLFRLSTLLENEKKSNCCGQYLPKISSTIFKDHKYNYGIYDWGVITIYNEGEKWNSDSKKFEIHKPQLNKNLRSFSYAFSKGQENFKHVEKEDGSWTTFDENGNSEIHYINGNIETKFKNGKTIKEYPNGAIDYIDELGMIKSTDFEGNLIIPDKKSIF